VRAAKMIMKAISLVLTQAHHLTNQRFAYLKLMNSGIFMFEIYPQLTQPEGLNLLGFQIHPQATGDAHFHNKGYRNVNNPNNR
jgi:hypothetical protein